MGSDSTNPTAGTAAAGQIKCPKCGQIQQRTSLCSGCGLDFREFLKARSALVQTMAGKSSVTPASSTPSARTAASSHSTRPRPYEIGGGQPRLPPKTRTEVAVTTARTQPSSASVSRPSRGTLAVAVGFLLINIPFAAGISNAPGVGELVGFIIGGVFLWPLAVYGIAAIWKVNRNPRRAVLVFNIASVFVLLSLFMQAGRRVTNESTAVAAAKTNTTLSAERLENLKRAVAYITVGTGRTGRSGTGFLIQKEDETGVLVTNAHVVRTEKRESSPVVEVVFNSGEPEELRLSARIAARDDATDLAILTVEASDLPEPIALSKTSEFAQTQDVLILGFPFGDALASNSETLAMTVGRGTVSSNRRDVNGQIGLVQIDGDLNPGNSGGPIVTSAGELVGVARSEVRSTNIGFAVPTREIGALLRGRISSLKSSKFGDVITVYALMADPFGEIAEASLRIVEAEPEAVMQARQTDGTWSSVPGRLHSYPFEPREYGDWVAKFSNSPLLGPSRYEVKHWIGQIGLKLSNGSLTYQAPFRIMVEDTGNAFYMGGPGVLANDTESYARRFERDKPVRAAQKDRSN